MHLHVYMHILDSKRSSSGRLYPIMTQSDSFDKPYPLDTNVTVHP
jgi:hypothetical protein